jgi:hypothetical protein
MICKIVKCMDRASNLTILKNPSKPSCSRSRTAVIALAPFEDDSEIQYMMLVVQYRANAASCRVRARNEPQNARYWLGEAKLWERLAEEEVSSHFIECNTTSSSDLAIPNNQ